MRRLLGTQRLSAWYPQLRMVARTGVLLLGIVIAAWGFTYLTAAILAPLISSHHEAVLLDRDTQSVQQKQAEKRRLEAGVAWLQSPEGAAEASRRKGMVKEGEHAVTFTFHAQPATGRLSSTTLTPAFRGRQWGVVLVLLLLSFLIGSSWLVRRRRLGQLRRPAGTLTPRSVLQRKR